MRTILSLIRKEFIQIKRDRRMLAIVFVAPVFQLIILGYAANLDVRNIYMVVYDADNSYASREFISGFTNSGYFTVVGNPGRLGDLDRYIDHNMASIGLAIPRGFADDLIAGIPVKVQLIADGSESNSATIGLAYASQIALRFSHNILIDGAGRVSGEKFSPVRIEPEMRIWYNPDLRSRNFMVPGVLAMLLMVMTMMLTSLATVKEREIGTLEQLIVTPMKPYQLIAGKLAPFTIIGIIDVLLVVLIATLWFNIPVRGGVMLLVGLSMVFLMTTLGLGLFVSTISRTQQQAMLTAVFFVMLPMIYLSGFIFPIENMPGIIRSITYIMPLRYFFVIVRGIFLKGIGIAELWDQILALFIIGSVILSASILRFRRNLE